MKNTFRFTILLVFSLLQIPLFAQDCATSEHHKDCLSNDPIYKKGFMKNEAYMKQKRKTSQTASRSSQNSSYVLPIVIHIIHIGENHSSNVDEQIVLNAVNRLNSDFNASFNSESLDTEIQFCLATIDPQGNPTNGINRVSGEHIQEYVDIGVRWSTHPGVDGSVIKDLSRWPTSDYINVWVAHRINGAGAFAEYPNGGLYDGIMMQPSNLLSSTFAHEMGHSLYLYHTFENTESDCGVAENDCNTQGDRVCDTPPHRTYECSNNACSDVENFTNSSRNFMSYCGNKVLFTEGQKARMHQTINGPVRRSLLSSIGCASNVPSNNVSILDITERDLPFCNGYTSPIIEVRNNGSQRLNNFEAKYRVNNGPYFTYVVSADLNYGESSFFTLEGIEMPVGENILEVEVLKPNGIQDEKPDHDKLEKTISIDVNNLVVSSGYFEDFETYYDLEYNLMPEGYSSYASEGAYSGWDHVRNGENVWLSCSSYSQSGGLESDVLQMPLIDLTDADNAKLLFKYSFTRLEEFFPEGFGLKVVAYRGCNGAGEILWEKYNSELQSAPLGYLNASESYKTIAIDLSDYKDELVKIEFHYSFNSNSFYYLNLDNILVQGNLNGENNSCQIPISLDMVFNPDGTQASANSGGASLFDEQDIIGEPGFGLGGNVEMAWLTPYAPSQTVYVDLGEDYNISSLYYYDTNGQGQFKIKPTLPTASSTQELSFNCSAWPAQWLSEENLNWQTRYLSFTKAEVGAHLSEIYICGTPADGTQETCFDGIQNQNETGVDCGGVCADCETSGSDCEENIAGYSFFGTSENHNYYLSNNILNWDQAEAQCQQNGGHLVTINSTAENDFIKENIENNFILIGVNDVASEGNFNWASGEGFGYNNIVGGNTASRDYGMMNFWDGSWTFVERNVQKKHLLEIPCSNDPEPGNGITLNCPENVRITLPFQATSGQVIYDVSATTDCGTGDVDISISGIPSGATTFFGSYPVEVSATDDCGNMETCSFNVDLLTRQHESTATCPDDITVIAADENGSIVTWEEPTATTDCESLTLIFQGFYESGDLIPVGTHQIDYAWREEGPEAICGGNASCNFQVTVLPADEGGDCPGEIDGFTVLGEYENSKFYISNTKKNWQDAQLFVALNTAGYLASIGSEGENEFIRSNIGNELVIIGLSDRQNEGTLRWDSGEPYNFSKLEVSNSNAGDNGYMNFWNGGWGLDSPWTSRKFILEVPCAEGQGNGISLTCPEDISIVLGAGESSREIEYEIQLSTDCALGGLGSDVSGGPQSGGQFFIGNYDMSVVATDNCGNFETCDFDITIIPDSGGPKPDMTLSNFSYNDFSVPVGEVLFFEVDISNIGTASSGAFSLKAYISTDRILSSDDVQDGVINTSNFLSGQVVQDVTGALTVPQNLSDGNYYVILVVDADDQLDELNENNNVFAATSQFEVTSGQVDCSENFPGATYIGAYNNSNYWISNSTYTWQEGSTYVMNNGGNLASVNTSGENQYLYQRLDNNIVFIGLNDAQNEGQFVWDSGDSFILNNLTNENSSSNDFVNMNFWDGAWGMDGRWTKRKLLIEVECPNAGASFREDAYLSDSNSQITKEKLKITKLFPNPASELIHIEIQSLESEKIQLKVYNMEGQLIKTESVIVLDDIQMVPLEIGEFNSGVYQLLISDDRGRTYAERFVKIAE